MKKVLFLIVMWAVCGGWANAQTSLEVVWEKNVPILGVKHVDFAPDGNSVYCASDYMIAQVDAETGKTMWVSDSLGYFTDLRVSPEGSYFITSYYSPGTAIWDTKTNKLMYYINPENSDNYRASFVAISPDGKYILMAYYKDENRFIAVYDYQNKTQIATIPCPFRITCLCYSHDGKTFAAGGYRTVGGFPDPVEKHDQVMLFDAENWKQIKLLEDSVGNGFGIRCLKFSFDDARIGFVRDIGDSKIIDIATNTIYEGFNEVKQYNIEMDFLPINGNYLYYKHGFNNPGEIILFNDHKKVASYNRHGTDIKVNNNNSKTKIITNSGYQLALLIPSPLGINELTTQTVTISYTNNVVNITYDNFESQSITVYLYNLEGKSVYVGSFDVSGSGKLRLNAELANGIYLYSIKTAKGVITDKFEVVN